MAAASVMHGREGRAWLLVSAGSRGCRVSADLPGTPAADIRRQARRSGPVAVLVRRECALGRSPRGKVGSWALLISLFAAQKRGRTATSSYGKAGPNC